MNSVSARFSASRRGARLALALAVALPAWAAAQTAPAADPPAGEARPRTLDEVVVSALPLGQEADAIVAPVVVLSGTALDDRKAATLGETVAAIPGVTTTYFGPGAGRPVIRGLDGARVAVLSGGLGTGDASNVSQDHAVTLEPFLADQIEVLKGPSTLLYGSGAIGGVVNAVDGRIRETALTAPASGRAELRYDAGSNGFTGMSRVDVGDERYTLHADAVYRRNDDLDGPDGTLANSFLDTRTGALGGTWYGERGFVGASVARYRTEYGNPAEPGDAAAGEPPVTLDMAQTRYDLKAALDGPLPGLARIALDYAHTDYEHTEFEGDEVGTRFVGDGDELRLQAQHRPLGPWRGAFGLQLGRRELAAIGDEAFVPGTRSDGVGVFVVEQGEWDRLKLEFGARGDRQRSDPDGGDAREFPLLGLSAGVRWQLADGWHLSLNLDRAQRAPAEEELFADGPHAATATYEIGDPALRRETANQAELGLHFHGARIEAEVAVYRNRYDDFIHLVATGGTDAGSGLPIRTWTQADADFRGIEGELTVTLADNAAGRFDLRLHGDAVQARRRGGGDLPRIPAARFGAELGWEGNAWRARLGVVRTAAQDDVDAFETPTDGYTLVDAGVVWQLPVGGRVAWEAFLEGDNLTDQDARLATSFVKDDVPLPGRNVSVGVRLYF